MNGQSHVAITQMPFTIDRCVVAARFEHFSNGLLFGIQTHFCFRPKSPEMLTRTLYTVIIEQREALQTPGDA